MIRGIEPFVDVFHTAQETREAQEDDGDSGSFGIQ
jgi:hypothetical protein